MFRSEPFFFRGFDFGTGNSGPSFVDASGAFELLAGLETGPCLLELNEDMNSKARGESPSKSFKCLAAASLGRDVEYVIICNKDSSSRESSFEICGRAHSVKDMATARTVLSSYFAGSTLDL